MHVKVDDSYSAVLKCKKFYSGRTRAICHHVSNEAEYIEDLNREMK